MIKKITYRLSLLTIVLVCFLISCSTTNTGTNTTVVSSDVKYKVYKNFSQIQSVSLLNQKNTVYSIQNGESIVGVLLKYTSEGKYNDQVYPIDANTFCVYCLFDNHGFNGDGMEFNYVLYIPEDIKNQYSAGGGINPDSGNPFWWYMITYFNNSIQDIQGNWKVVIDFLIKNTECPKAKSTDVSEFWKK